MLKRLINNCELAFVLHLLSFSKSLPSFHVIEALKIKDLAITLGLGSHSFFLIEPSLLLGLQIRFRIVLVVVFLAKSSDCFLRSVPFVL